MKPSAHIQSALDILTVFEDQRFPLDRICSRYFKDRRYIGAQDRRFISDLVFDHMRRKNLYDYWAQHIGLAPSPRSALLVHLQDQDVKTLFSGEPHGPKKLTPSERKALQNLPADLAHRDLPDSLLYGYPEWVEPYVRDSFQNLPAEMMALNQPAPFDLRVNPLFMNRQSLQKSLAYTGFDTTEMPYSPYGLRCETRFPLDQTEAFKTGEVEIQDEGSQLICLLSQVKPTHQVLDFCAGAGGKTLLLAALMQNKGHLTATDVNKRRLTECKKRLKRAGLQNAHTHLIQDERDASLKKMAGKMDCVLVDAPCTGSGTWRRNPDLKWRMGPQDLTEICLKQASILQEAAKCVKPGGRLIYATCSLFQQENQHQVHNFLQNHPNFKVSSAEDIWHKALGAPCPFRGDFLHLSPHKTGTDGFFTAILTKNL